MLSTASTRYEDLIAWQKAMDLVDLVYEATRNWPADERFGQTSQIRRAAVSVPANIAEGQGRNGSREFIHHLGIAFASLCELETLGRIATRQAYQEDGVEKTLLAQCREVARLINGLINSLRRSNS